MRAVGAPAPEAPSVDVSEIHALTELWTGAGLQAVETRVITVQRTFGDFDDYWTTILGAPSAGPTLAAMSADDLARLKTRLRGRLPADASGRITCSARANAVKGRRTK